MHNVEGRLIEDFIKALTFSLTPAQVAVLDEIKQDMAKPQPMQRLLQGDVGSGKTIVATIASLIAIQGGYQAAFMVPTEILAKQHHDKIKCQVSGIRYRGKEIKVELLTSSLNKKEKEKLAREISEGKIDLVVGTHALLRETLEFKKLGLAIIDEQHKFGVGQRALLAAKGPNPDILIMTATPIPRTLAITLYGDLDISVITQLPPGRGPVQTEWITSDKKQWLWDFLKGQIQAGRQAYIIYPVIEESFALDLLSAKKMYAQLQEKALKDYRLGLIHGRQKEAWQQRIMSEFKAGKIQVLVATTILEVGIDIANATVMVVEQAERFGLSQLHQLRGRIGRGEAESFCFLVSDTDAPEGRKRLGALVKHSDGFQIAEQDLRIRGPGEFFGRRQHGLTELKIGNPLLQLQLLKLAREEAIKLIARDPQFNLRQNILLKEKLLQRFPEYEKLVLTA